MTRERELVFLEYSPAVCESRMVASSARMYAAGVTDSSSDEGEVSGQIRNVCTWNEESRSSDADQGLECYRRKAAQVKRWLVGWASRLGSDARKANSYLRSRLELIAPPSMKGRTIFVQGMSTNSVARRASQLLLRYSHRCSGERISGRVVC